jgi:predicted AlkP superfamily phosphohydrolase/phosphomutase
MAMTEKRKVLVIGLDGAEPSLVFKWAKEGKLPNIAKLMENGAYGKLKSTIPPITGPAWVSFMTGKNPGKHGIYYFLQRKKNSYQRKLVSSKSINGKTLWRILSDAGLKVGVVNVPLTYPPEKVNGFIVSGYMTPSEKVGFTYPENLKNLLLKMGYRINDNEKLRFYEGGRRYLEDLYDVLRRQNSVVLYLIEEYDWDFFMYVFQGLDHVQHIFWKYMDSAHILHDSEAEAELKNAIENYYKECDKQIGEMIKKSEKNILIILLSDHGFGRCVKRIYINNWLLKKGLLALREKYGKSLSNKEHISKQSMYRLLVKFRLEKLSKIIPKKIKDQIPSNIPEYSDIDWQKTKVYAHGAYPLIYINLKGREPQGIVEPGEEYENLRNYIINELYKLKDPETGEKVIDKIYKKEEIYWGENLDKAPDIIAIQKDEYTITTFGDISSNVISPIKDGGTGTHRIYGTFIASGNRIKKININDVEIVDIFPTILYYFGLPIPKDVDGRVLKEIFVEDFRPSL